MADLRRGAKLDVFAMARKLRELGLEPAANYMEQIELGQIELSPEQIEAWAKACGWTALFQFTKD